MSDRWVFATAFLTVVLIVAGAFAVPEYFSFELLKSLIYVVIAVMAFFGEDRFSYMLGIVAPILGSILNILLGGFFREFSVLWDSITARSMAKVDTPLHGAAILVELALVVLCYRVWRKQVPEKFFGKTFGICLAISFVYVGILTGWFFHKFPTVGQLP
jgi:hypothetical protein